MKTPRNPGRVAGLWYLLLLVAPLRLMYIPTKLFVDGDANATAANIAAHQLLFRMGMVTDVMCGAVLVFLTLAFYRLFKGVSQMLAAQVVILGGVMAGTLYFVNVVNDAAALVLIRGADFLNVFSTVQRNALAVFFLKLHFQAVLADEMLWGLWLLPLAILVYKSKFIPRFLGVWLLLGGLAWVAMCLTGLLMPQSYDAVYKWTQPAQFGELALMLWLLIKGARSPEFQESRR
jgi:hypothetical protein